MTGTSVQTDIELGACVLTGSSVPGSTRVCGGLIPGAGGTLLFTGERSVAQGNSPTVTPGSVGLRARDGGQIHFSFAGASASIGIYDCDVMVLAQAEGKVRFQSILFGSGNGLNPGTGTGLKADANSSILFNVAHPPTTAQMGTPATQVNLQGNKYLFLQLPLTNGEQRGSGTLTSPAPLVVGGVTITAASKVILQRAAFGAVVPPFGPILLVFKTAGSSGTGSFTVTATDTAGVPTADISAFDWEILNGESAKIDFAQQF
jgi:hypothetical protein